MDQFFSAILVLLTMSKVESTVVDIFCYIEGQITNDGKLNGTFHSCEPEQMECSMNEKSDLNLDATHETVVCAQKGFLWDLENYCSFVHLTRKSYCYDMKHCYGVKMKCPSSSIFFTSFSKTDRVTSTRKFGKRLQEIVDTIVQDSSVRFMPQSHQQQSAAPKFMATVAIILLLLGIAAIWKLVRDVRRSDMLDVREKSRRESAQSVARTNSISIRD